MARVKHAHQMIKDRETFPPAFIQALMGMQADIAKKIDMCENRSYVLTENDLRPWLKALANMDLARFRKPQRLNSGDSNA